MSARQQGTNSARPREISDKVPVARAVLRMIGSVCNWLPRRLKTALEVPVNRRSVLMGRAPVGFLRNVDTAGTVDEAGSVKWPHCAVRIGDCPGHCAMHEWVSFRCPWCALDISHCRRRSSIGKKRSIRVQAPLSKPCAGLCCCLGGWPTR